MEMMIKALAAEFQIQTQYIKNIVELLDDGNTIPFIARYRKERHGALDDQKLREIADRLAYLRSLEKRKEEVSDSIEGQGKLTEETALAIRRAVTLTELEDIYRPFKPKRRTRASMARERGLGPLAELIYAQNLRRGSLSELAAAFIDPEKGVETAEDAINGAKDIIAEELSDDSALRKRLRALCRRKGILTVTGDGEADSVYRLYYDFSERVDRLRGHQVLAVNRGEKEGLLKAKISIDRPSAVEILYAHAVRPGSVTTQAVEEAACDAWDRLILPSVEREERNALTETASEQAIGLFAVNLKATLMQPPVRGRVTLGLDPAYRTGCKIAVVDETGKLLDTAVIYPTPPHNKTDEGKKVLQRLIKAHNVSCIAIGNGTASKESELFVADLIGALGGRLSYMVVNEAGASVYSASKLAAAEFPQLDVSLRSAVSIARRLQDPLAELVKIDPKSIGVGQYQHDMPPNRLGASLDGVVEDCVNSVGAELNTASAPLLTRVAGLSGTVAKNIVAYREENGPFQGRKALLKVPKLGPKAFEQCAGFLRVPESKNILDHTSVHPESYKAAETLLTLCGYTQEDVRRGALSELKARLDRYGVEAAAKQCGVGVPTLLDIADSLMRPGRDPRDELPPPQLRTDVMDMNDLKPGMILTGTVRNVVDFGAFVDIGVHQDGLVHVSQLANRFIRHPSEAVTAGDVVNVMVLEVDAEKKRISLSMKQAEQGE